MGNPQPIVIHTLGNLLHIVLTNKIIVTKKTALARATRPDPSVEVKVIQQVIESCGNRGQLKKASIFQNYWNLRLNLLFGNLVNKFHDSRISQKTER